MKPTRQSLSRYCGERYIQLADRTEPLTVAEYRKLMIFAQIVRDAGEPNCPISMAAADLEIALSEDDLDGVRDALLEAQATL